MNSYRISGTDLTQIDGINVMNAQTIIAEVGVDMSRFPTEAHFASFLGLCPDNQITGGKVLHRGTRHVREPCGHRPTHGRHQFVAQQDLPGSKVPPSA
jgi:transposase